LSEVTGFTNGCLRTIPAISIAEHERLMAAHERFRTRQTEEAHAEIASGLENEIKRLAEIVGAMGSACIKAMHESVAEERERFDRLVVVARKVVEAFTDPPGPAPIETEILAIDDLARTLDNP